MKRNPDAVKAALAVNKAGQVICKEACRIHLPLRFTEKGLGAVGIQTFAYGFFPIILDRTDEYSVMSVTALIELDPTKTTVTTIDDVEYYEFHFSEGAIVIKNTNLLCVEKIMYNVFDEFIFMGKLPWYAEYEDVGKLFDTAKKHAGSNVGNNLEVIEFLAAMITRPKSDRMKYLRTVLESYKDAELKNIDYVPLKSIFYSVKSTINKLAGSYFNPGIQSALVNPTKSVDKIEQILRA